VSPDRSSLAVPDSRRAFLRKAGFTALVAPVAVGSLAACTAESQAAPKASKSQAASAGHSGGTTASVNPPTAAPLSLAERRAEADAMDACTRRGSRHFPPRPRARATSYCSHPIKPDEVHTYEFTVPVGNAGSHMYHSHHNAAKRVGLGLLGGFIVEPKRPRAIEKDVDYTMILNDGMHMTVIDKDGWAQPVPWKCDTLNIAPGERWDVVVDCNNPGTWAFHCHILPHAETEHGMFGMVTALVAEK
jgi:FtsP/CotA-like multicopper oxidase with cupredoxin domain